MNTLEISVDVTPEEAIPQLWSIPVYGETRNYFAEHHFISDGDKVYPLRSGLRLDVLEEDASVVIVNEEYSLYAREGNYGEAIVDFDRALLSLWERYRALKPEEMSPSATRLQAKLNYLFSA